MDLGAPPLMTPTPIAAESRTRVVPIMSRGVARGEGLCFGYAQTAFDFFRQKR